MFLLRITNMIVDFVSHDKINKIKIQSHELIKHIIDDMSISKFILFYLHVLE
jgi:hypothetical protein